MKIEKISILHKDEIISILQANHPIGLKEIKVLTNCTDSEARALRINALASYLPTITKTEDRKNNVQYPCIKAKVRLDKFLAYYDDKNLIELYYSIWGKD